MIHPEIAQRIKEIEIYTRSLASGSLVGDTRAPIKGSGFDFDQIREYQQGDDVRFIDWNSSARSDSLRVKEYIEERNRTIIIAVDISPSVFYGSSKKLKISTMSLIASILTLVGEYGKDQVGLVLFGQEVLEYIPPAVGRLHTRRILERLLMVAPAKGATHIKKALDFLGQIKKRNAVIFFISDFIDSGYESTLKVVAYTYDFVAICLADSKEIALDAIGFLPVQDSETGQTVLLDARKKGVPLIAACLQKYQKDFQKMCASNGVDMIQLRSDESSMANLVHFLRRRMRS